MSLIKKITKIADKVNQVQQQAISSVQEGVIHAAKELASEAKDPIKLAKISMEQLDSLQQELVRLALEQQENIINEAKQKAETIIKGALYEIERQEQKIKELIFEELCERFINSGIWYKKLIGRIMIDNKDIILRGL
jgi:hypothetical protein